MTNLLLRWAINALALLVVTYFVPGVAVSGIFSALVAAAVIGLVNATLGAVIRFITIPFRILTLGLLSLVINAFMLMIAAALVPGFTVSGFFAAFIGSILLSIVTSLLGMLLPDDDKKT